MRIPHPSSRSLTLGLTGVLAAALLLPSSDAGAWSRTPSDHASASLDDHRAAPPAPATDRRAGVPRLKVRKLARGLDHPWDVAALPGGALLVTQRDQATLSVVRHRKVEQVAFPSQDVWVSGETGLMGLVVDPAFSDNRRFYTCQGGTTSGGRDVRVMAWTLSEDLRTATSAGQLLGGLPATSGRHGGCRLLVDRAGSLLVGTGDAAVGTNPRDLDSLGGKTLRLDRFSGAPWPANRYAAAGGARAYVHTVGHRNVQGLAQRRDGSLWSIEQGSFRDDEANLLKNGADYGWNPVPGYDESVPMTDPSLPGRQVRARWRSGDPTLAASGGTFVPTDRRWGALSGTLAIATLKAERVVFVRFDRRGQQVAVRVPKALRQYGRIRTVVADGTSLLVTTDNGSGRDVVLRVRPRGR